MSIIRAPRPESNFLILDKAISEDKRLGWKQRGLIVFLIGKPDNWKVSVAHLVRETQDSVEPLGRDGVQTLLKQLSALGYVEMVQTRHKNGKIAGTDYIVYDSPKDRPQPQPAQPVTVPDSPQPAQPVTAQPLPVNPDLISIETPTSIKTASSIEKSSTADENTAPANTRTAEQARRLEYAKIADQYGASVRVANPELNEWFHHGVTDDELIDAIRWAFQARRAKNNSQPVTTPYLNTILKNTVLPLRKAKRNGATARIIEHGQQPDLAKQLMRPVSIAIPPEAVA